MKLKCHRCNHINDVQYNCEKCQSRLLCEEVELIEEKLKEYIVYVLELESKKYYVGSSTVIDKRIQKHFKGKGATWTTLHKPIRIIEERIIGQCTYRQAELEESQKAVNFMRTYGWQHVRGGFFSNVDETAHLKSLRAHSKKFSIDFIEFPSDKPQSFQLTPEALSTRIQASAAAYFGNKYAHEPLQVLATLDCRVVYHDWLNRFYTRHGEIELNEEEVLKIFEKLRAKRIRNRGKK